MDEPENNPQISKQPQPEDSMTPKTGSPVVDWIVRLVKGIIVGIGAILPGLSGGVLAVVFGIYEPLLRFLANIKNKFWKNIRFFLPIGIGVLLGVVAFSAVVDFAFSNFAAQFIWLFIGFISGTFPSLIKVSGKEGRKPWHWALLAVVALGMYLFLNWMATFRTVTLAPSLGIWLMSGALVGLGLVVPGLSPSNFLIYLGLYQPMAAGISKLDFGVILPIGVGLVLCILIFAKLIAWLFKKSYTVVYHVILGIVVGSTLAIIPGGVKGWTIAVCALLFVLGAAASYALAKVDERHPHESLF